VKRLVKIYRRNIYGVIGTLLFHIFLFSAFLLAEVDMKGNVKEEVLLIEFPDIIPEPEKVPEEDEKQNNEDSPQNNSERLTNAASNRLAAENTTKSSKEFFDENYLKEVEDAQKLRANVKNQLSKEIVDLSDIKMPVETTEGINPDSIKNKKFIGESNIVYFLENRYHTSLPIPVYLTQSGGKVIVDIVVNQQGEVIDAAPRVERQMKDEQIYLYAKTAAMRTLFNADLKAPKAQKGSIHYTFIKQ
jgi:hypothetical protein